MADKVESKITGVPWAMVTVIGIFAAILILGTAVVKEDAVFPTYLNLEYVFYRIVKILVAIWEALVNGSIYTILSVILGIIGVLMVIVISYTSIKTKEIQDAQKETLKKAGIAVEPVAVVKNERWESIEKHSESENPNDWRQAIIEADIILDEMVTRMGYKGDNLGEKLKSIEASDFVTLNNAWEGHKVRNRIAHEGAEFVLTKRQAKETIELYKSVFREFEYI